MDITPIKQYIEQPDNFMIKYVKHEVNRLGVERFLDISIKALDASKIWDDGLRPIQTISYIYVRAITEIIYTIDNYVEDENYKNEILEKLIAQHNFNKEYEKEHPPVDYDANSKVKSSKSTSKKKSEPKSPRRRDELSAADKKLIDHVVKISALKINLKK